MGYSISVEFPNEETANKMKAFLASEQARLILSEIVPENLLDPSGWVSGDQLAYPPKTNNLSNVLGHHISASMENNWYWYVSVWMACKEGVKTKGLPVVCWDDEKCFIKPVGSEGASIWANDNGVMDKSRRTSGFSLANLFNQTKKKEKMVEQLNELYSTWETGLTSESSPSKPKTKM